MNPRPASRIGLLSLIGLLAACSTPAATASPTASATPTVAATAEATEPPGVPIESQPAPEPCPAGDLCTGLLSPGGYTTDAVGDTTLTLTVDQEWVAEELPDVGGIALYPIVDESRSDISAFRFTGNVFPDPCDIETTEAVDATPEAMIEWLSAHPELEVSEPEEATLGEATGLRVEVTATKGGTCPADQPIPPDWILLWELPAVGDFHFNDGEGAVVYALQLGEDLLIVLAESVLDPDGFLPVAQPVIDSMRFTPP